MQKLLQILCPGQIIVKLILSSVLTLFNEHGDGIENKVNAECV